MRILLKTLMDNSYCGVLENRARRPCSTMVSMANLSRTVVSVPRPPARSKGIHYTVPSCEPSRNPPGLTPNSSLKHLLKYEGEVKPTS